MSRWKRDREAWLLSEWPTERAKGMWRFVWTWTKVWGGFLLIVGTAYSVYLRGLSELKPLLLAINVMVMGSLGALMGFVMWYSTERQFRNAVAEKAGKDQ
jgi:hypothetical protein